ncbi:Unknown protein, partial [Striga hermonthica]
TRQKSQEDFPRHVSTSGNVIIEADSPLAPELTAEALPVKVKIPQIGMYDGTSDPDAHLGHYTSWMDLHGASDALRCRIFSLTLGPRAQKWYYTLPPHSIWKWQHLRAAFRSHFIRAQICLIPKESITNIVQKDDETVKDYMSRFNDRIQNMEPCHPEILLVTAIAGLKPNSMFRWTLCQNKPATFQEFLVRAQQFIIDEESMLVFTYSTLFGTSTDNCKKSKAHDKSGSSPCITRINSNAKQLDTSRRKTKAYAREAQNAEKRVMNVDLRDTINQRNCPITFNIEDANLFAHPHSDTLIITAPIGGIPVHRTMVDTGAYSSILMLRTFEKLGLDPVDIRPCNDQIQGLNGSISRPVGEILLPIQFGGFGPKSKIIMETFKVLDVQNEYNVVVGRTALYKLRAA